MRVKPPMKRPELHLQFLLPKLLPLLPSTTFIDKKALATTGGFDEQYTTCEDIHLFTRIAEKFDIAKLDFFNCCRRMHDLQATKRLDAILFWREQHNLEYLKRHDFCFFCTTHDRKKQARIAEHLGDLMLESKPGALPKTAAYLYQQSLLLNSSNTVQAKLEHVQANLPEVSYP